MEQTDYIFFHILTSFVVKKQNDFESTKKYI